MAQQTPQYGVGSEVWPAEDHVSADRRSRFVVADDE
jgi:hypothetical protein